MKRIFTILSFTTMMVIGAFFNARADHMVGSDIYWKCDGGDTFTITIVDYRDCNGIAFVNSPFVLTPVGNCPGVFKDSTVNGKGSGGADITPVCNRSCDRCTDKTCVFPYGIQQYFITATVVLPKGCCDYQISWEQCCRSAGITTGATWADYYITSKMSRCTFGYCDNSPYFSEPPVAIYCTGQCITYNPGANDVDRGPTGAPDSLSYAFTAPLTGAGSYTPWTGDYTYLKPLDYDGFPNTGGVWNPPSQCKGFHLDSTTGDIYFKAVKPDVTVIALAVSEWRKDSTGAYRKIGEIRRDMQIIVIDCPANHPPIIPGINGGTTYSEKICADQQTCFQVKAFDLDLPDTDYLSWNNPGTMSGASFTVIPNGQKWPTAVFCWFPTDKDVRSYPYTFVATALDNACPIPGRSSKAFNIYVIAAPKADYSATVQKCGMVYFQASPDKGSTTTITNYLWVGEGSPGHGPLYKIGKTASYQYTAGGTYHYTLEVTGPNGCVRSYADSVNIAPFPGILLPKDTAVCNNSPTISVSAKLINAKKPLSIWWNLSSKDSSHNGVQTISETITHDTVLRVNLFDEGCPNYDSMKVKVIPLPKPNIGPDRRGCWGKGIMLTTGLKKHMPIANWTWINGKDTLKNQFHGDTIIVADSGIYTVSVQDSIGCPGTDSVSVFFNPLVQVRALDTTVCLGDSVKLHAGIGGSGASYTWIDVIHNKTISTAPVYKFLASAKYGYGLQADFKVVIRQSQHGITCADTNYINVTVNTPTHPILDSLKPKCIQDPAYQLGTTPPWVDIKHENGTWYYPRNPSAVVNNYLYPSLMGRTDNNHKLGYVHYLYVNQFRCITDDSAHITISDQPQVSAGPDTTICTGNGNYLLNNRYVTPSGGLWFPLKGTPNAALAYSKNHDSIFFNPNASGVSDTVYGVIYSYQSPPINGKSSCSNSDTVYIRVRTNPKVTVVPVDSLCLNASPVQFTSMTPQNGIWQFAPGDQTNKHALKFDSYSQTYSFLADSAGPGWHRLTYTAYGDAQRHLCPTVMADSMYVVAAPQNVAFHTSDSLWEYCVSHANVTLIPTSNKKVISGGSFSAGKEVFPSGKSTYFDPSTSDTVNTNPVKYILPYNHNQCQVTYSHNIKVDGKPYVRINSAPNVCEGQGNFELTVTKFNANHLTWSSNGIARLGFTPKNTDSSDVEYFPTNNQQLAGKFNISVSASNNGVCAAYTATKQFTINQPPVVVFSSIREGCEPLVVHFNSDSVSVNNVTVSTNPAVVKAFDWDFGDGSAHSSSADPYHVYKVTNGKDTQQFNVTLTVVSDSGCVRDTVKRGWITAFATPKPVIVANPQYTTIALPQVQFSFDPKSVGIDFTDPKTTFKWTFGDSAHGTSNLRNPTYTYADTGTFKVRVLVNSKGCTGDTFIMIYVKPELIIYIPNVFKPNYKHGERRKIVGYDPNYFSTEENNTFQPVISAYTSFEMTVYNRWGQLMYTTSDPHKGWDGTFQDKESPQDAYVYVVKATGFDGRAYTFTGTITLLR